jgi:hypothetical protein
MLDLAALRWRIIEAICVPWRSESLRAQAVTRLAEIAMQIRSVSGERPGRADVAGTETMNQTPFPATPALRRARAGDAVNW